MYTIDSEAVVEWYVIRYCLLKSTSYDTRESESASIQQLKAIGLFKDKQTITIMS
jgi:hypothetical protein